MHKYANPSNRNKSRTRVNFQGFQNCENTRFCHFSAEPLQIQHKSPGMNSSFRSGVHVGFFIFAIASTVAEQRAIENRPQKWGNSIFCE
jgi:hypothetical protein